MAVGRVGVKTYFYATLAFCFAIVQSNQTITNIRTDKHKIFNIYFFTYFLFFFFFVFFFVFFFTYNIKKAKWPAIKVATLLAYHIYTQAQL